MTPLRKLFVALGLTSSFAVTARSDDFSPLRYDQPGLVVDLEVGLWAVPLVMDYDNDGDFDLVVSTMNKPSNGIYFFENPNAEAKFPVFRPRGRIGRAKNNAAISYVAGEPRVAIPGAWYPEFRATQLAGDGARVEFKPSFHTGRTNHWKFFDYDGDGTHDLIVGASDWRAYGWDDAFDASGRWTRGPLHGFVYFVKNLGTDAAPRYGDAEQLRVGDAPLDVFGCPSPNFADWDSDGDEDLICGEFLDGFTYFENFGTRAAPRWATGRRLYSREREIRMELQMLQVQALDWDSDGDVDLIVGQEDGRVALLECSGHVVDRLPEFLPPRFFRQEAEFVKVGVLTTPSGCDWDGDGDEDLICGDTAGYLSWVENVGDARAPRWRPPRRLRAGGEVIRIQAGPNGSIQGPAEAKWGYTVPCAADWDGDGRVDIVVNSIWGEVLWYRNTGSAREARLEPARPILVEWSGPPPKPAWNWWSPRGRQLVTQWRTSPVVVDLRGNGLPDLVMLDHEGYLAFFERVRVGDGLRLRPGARIFFDEDGEPLRLNGGHAGKSGRRKLAIVDWDGDGKLDLLANGTNADFYRNVAEEEGAFRFRHEGPVSERRLSGHTTCPAVVDWNGDNVPDLVVGTEDGILYHLENPRSRGSNPSPTAPR